MSTKEKGSTGVETGEPKSACIQSTGNLADSASAVNAEAVTVSAVIPGEQDLDPLGEYTPEEIEQHIAEYAAERAAAEVAMRDQPPAPKTRILRRRELSNPPHTTLIDLPGYQPDRSQVQQRHVIAILWTDDQRPEAVFRLVERLHRHRLLPMVALVVMCPDDLIILAVNTGWDEWIPRYKVRLAQLAWAFVPFRVAAVCCTQPDADFAEAIGCGIHDVDDSAGRTS